MQTINKPGRLIVSIAVIVGVLALSLGLWIQQRHGSHQQLTMKQTTLLPTPQPINAFQLTQFRKKAFTNNNLKGRWSLLFFGFTRCPQVCPTTLSELNKAFKILKKENKSLPQVVFISVDTARDTPKLTSTYARGFNQSFVGVTGSAKQIKQLTRELSVVYMKVTRKGGEKNNYSIDHSGTILVINPQGQLAGIMSLPHEGKDIALDMATLMG